MNRIIRTVLASVGAAAVVSGGALGVAFATTPAPAPAWAADQGTNPVADLSKDVNELTAQIDQLEKDLAEPMPTLATATPTPAAEPPAEDPAPAPAAPRTAVKAPAAATKAAETTERESDDEKSGDSTKGDSDD